MSFEHPYIRIANVTPEKLDEKEAGASRFPGRRQRKEGFSPSCTTPPWPGDLTTSTVRELQMQYYVVSGHGLAGAG